MLKLFIDIPLTQHKALAFFAAPLVMLAGCQSYQAKPLDISSTRMELASRSASSEQVMDFAKRLAAINTNAIPSDFDPSNGLTLAEAEIVALVFNPELRVARLQVGVLQATADTAGLWQDPVTGFNFNDVMNQSGGGTALLGGQIALTIPISGRLEAEVERAGAALFAEMARVQAAEWMTRIQLRRAWSSWTSAIQRIGIVQQTVQNLQRIIEIVNRMEAVGELPRVEARLFRIEQTTQHVELERLKMVLKEEEVALKRIMGFSSLAIMNLVPGQMAAESPTIPNELREHMINQSPVIAALKAEYQVSEKVLAREIREQYPDVQLGPSYNTDGNEDFTFGFMFPLPLWNHNKQGVQEAGAERELMRARFETTLEIQLAELQRACVVYESAVMQRRMMEEQLLPLVDLQATETQHIAQLGEVNTLLLLQSFTGQQSAKLSLVDARNNETISFINITQLVGPAPLAQPTLEPVTQTQLSNP